MDTNSGCTHKNSLSSELFFGDDEKHRSNCEACGQKISNTRGYYCQRCKVCLHESCANGLQNLPHEIIHPLHPQHKLELQLQRSWDFVCDKCLYISAGSRYHCSLCDFNLDLTCAAAVSNMNDQVPVEVWKRRTIRHYFHREELIIFKYRKIKDEDYYCVWCEKRLRGVCYGSFRSGFYLHELCKSKIPRTLYDHPFHPSHSLLRFRHISRSAYCNACRQDILFRTFLIPAYSCEKGDFTLDFHCAKLSPTLKTKLHRHLLTYFGNYRTGDLGARFTCSKCYKPCDNCYRCVPCDITFHLECVVSSSAKHRYHRHPLKFMAAFREDDDSDDYYCDICEEERNPLHPVYFCRDCTFIAHIECLLNYHQDEFSSENASSSSMDSNDLLEWEMEHNDEGIDGIHSTPDQQLLVCNYHAFLVH
ncbi:Zinc finger, ZZ-type [Corchorus olitorius]|uniref:Zinc finger, ZZ-type n=1 Tax=Corchorus olitorius TaxID=93759 RepID=A0A1R3JMP8_9ROSI|nr:Zinc finger, ZZ-type [Corchorus olitorius]